MTIALLLAGKEEQNCVSPFCPQNAFKFKPVVRAGNSAPAPPRLSSILEFAFGDQGQVAIIGDGGLILKSGSSAYAARILAPQARAAERSALNLHLRFAAGTSVLKFKKWITNILQAFKMGAMSTSDT